MMKDQNRLTFIELNVSSLINSRGFYRDVLGLGLVASSHDAASGAELRMTELTAIRAYRPFYESALQLDT